MVSLKRSLTYLLVLFGALALALVVFLLNTTNANHSKINYQPIVGKLPNNPTQQKTAADDPFNDEIKQLNIQLDALSVQLGMTENAFKINKINAIKKQLEENKRLLNSKDEWKEQSTAQLVLVNIKAGLKSLKESMNVNLEGDWGKINFKIDPSKDAPREHIKYQYKF